jgi:1,2-phenylacetyl-CoA epoxidase PaaB subunit
VMAKKPKPRARRWSISLLKGTPAKLIGAIDAPDAETAIKMAAEQFRVREADRFRLVARRVG